LRLSIGYRLFLAVLLSVMAVAAIGVELVRWTLFDNFRAYPSSIEAERMDSLADALSAQFRQRHDWSFLPAESAQRKVWLRREWADLQQGPQPTRGVLPSQGYRIGLLDKDGSYLAGAIANPLMIAFASIDTIRRPLVVEGMTIGYLILAKPQNSNDELAVAFLVQQQRNVLLVAAISVLLSGLAAALLAVSFRRPIKQLVAGARRLEKAQFNTRLTTHRSDELGELADAFNHLAARLEETEHSRREWVAVTSHELRTPLSVLRGQLEALHDGVRTATPENIATMLRQVSLLTKLIDELHQLARADVGHWPYNMATGDLWSVVVGEWEGFSEKFRAAGLAASLSVRPPGCAVEFDVDRMRQVVSNLLENSVRYTTAGGRIDLSGSIVGQELRIVIDDSAPAVPEQSLGRLGERFFRVEPSRSRQLGGAGLGLALCGQILEAHDGRLEFGPSPLGGLRATIVLKQA
jgi:two-component system, OmpR family, sensor histidine kinase BaeS